MKVLGDQTAGPAVVSRDLGATVGERTIEP